MRRKIPSLQALVVFEAAARHLSFSHAAQALALTQSAVSRQITALETLLGVALFRRGRHGVTLTAAGSAYAQQVAQRLQGLEQDTLDLMNAPRRGGQIHLASVPTFATRWLIPRLGDFAAQHPDITVHIETRTRPFLFADTVFDAALYTGTPEQVQRWAGTRSLALMEEDVVVVCAPRFLGTRKALRPQTLAQLPLLQQSTRPGAWRQWFDAAGVDAPQALAGPRFELFSMTAAAAAQGLGLALVPRLLVQKELARGELVLACALAQPSERAYYLVIPEDGETRPALEHFSRWLQQASRN